ncbi:MAG: O-antigen ligase family protein [Gammaproteobacteria bacterium]|nr:O-antigen ligase family protein [Gammaproteobacteria bacterium]
MEPSAEASPRQDTLFRLTALLLIVAPLFRAGNRPLPLMLLEFFALAVILLAFWSPTHERRLSPGIRWSLLVLFLFPLLYLIPLPEFLWQALPGRGIYTDLLAGAGGGDGAGWRPASLVPMNTETAWLALLPPIAVFLATMRFDTTALKSLVHLLFAVAAFQAALGLIQFGAGPDSVFYLGNPMGGNATGTYPNRNHLAGLLEMVFPISLALTVASVGLGGSRNARRGRWRQRLDFFSTGRGHRAFAYGALTLLFLLTIVFTRSRSGIVLSMLGIFISIFAFSRRLGGDNIYGTAGTVVAASIGLAAIIGLAPVLDRFSAIDTVENARIRIFASSIDGIGEFFPVGSGPGNYPETYPRFEPPALAGGKLVNHAHNDYLEWLFEGGLLAGAIIAVFIVIYLRQWSQVWTRGAWGTFRFIQVGAGIGILLMLLHGLTDFNQRIPANMIYLAFLSALFLSPEKDKGRIKQKKHHHHHTHHAQSPTPQESPATPPPADANIRNPFMD